VLKAAPNMPEKKMFLDRSPHILRAEDVIFTPFATGRKAKFFLYLFYQLFPVGFARGNQFPTAFFEILNLSIDTIHISSSFKLKIQFILA
jgi:hypothetical protein